MAREVHVTLLGRVAIEVGAEAFPEPVPGPLGRVALAFLVLHRDRPVTRDELAEALWGREDLPPTWASALRGVVFRLRRALTTLGLPGAEVLRNSVGSYLLHLPDDASVDMERAGQLLEAARASLGAGLALDAQRAAESAAHLSRGQFLPGAHGAWVEQHQAAARELHLCCLELLSEAATVAGDHAVAVASAEAAISHEPYRESAHFLLMQAHSAAGNRTEVVRAYARCKAFLRRDLGMEPSPATVALHRAILGGGQDAAPSLAAHPTATNLPTAMSSFVGRERILDELHETFTRTRLLTLTGPAGVGKSRLAVELGHRLQTESPDGVWLVELADVRAPELVPKQALGALRVPEAGGSSPAASLARALAERRLVLVLDNCEHMVDACASLVCDLLRASPGLRVLVTSREPLRVSGECVRMVPVLDVPPADVTDGVVTGVTGAAVAADGSAMTYGSVRLFTDRVLAMTPNHPLEPESAVIQICQQLDGLPLALELAAAHARLMPLEDLARHLHQEVATFTRSRRGSPDRHRTLESALNWSHDRLSGPEQELFAQLSVFQGGFTLGAVEAMFPSRDERVVELLGALVDKSLVLLEGRAGTMRYRLLETTRDYARQRLAASGRAAEACAAHLHWFTGHARSMESELEGPLQDKCLDALAREHDNFRAALDWAARCGEVEQVATLALALNRFWEVRGYLTEGRAWLELAARGAVDNPALAAKCHNAAGVLAHHKCDYIAARQFHRAAAGLFEHLGDRRGLAVAANGLANIDVSEGDLASAQGRYESVIALGRELADDRLLAASLLNLGVVALEEHVVFEGRYGRQGVLRARAALLEALDLYRRHGNMHGIAVALQNLGVLFGIDGDDGAARRYLGESLAISRHLGDLKGIAGTVRFLGQLEYRTGDYGAARLHFEECIRLEQQLGSTRLRADALTFLAAIAERETRAGIDWSLERPQVAGER